MLRGLSGVRDVASYIQNSRKGWGGPSATGKVFLFWDQWIVRNVAKNAIDRVAGGRAFVRA
jgi:hypothetical protein